MAGEAGVVTTTCGYDPASLESTAAFTGSGPGRSEAGGGGKVEVKGREGETHHHLPQRPTMAPSRLPLQNLESEAPRQTPGGTSSPAAPGWPQRGGLSFRDVDMRYRVDLPLVLKKLCFEIAPEETVGIVGRTGSGRYPRAPSSHPDGSPRLLCCRPSEMY